MILDWLIREGSIVVSWWLLVTLSGIAVMPLCMRLLHGLPDKGYTLSRTVGMLLVGFVFWFLAVVGFLRNTPGNMILSWLIVLIVSWVLYFSLPGERPNWRAWWQENRAVIVTGEILFFALLFGWALFRAYNPGLTGTEKPMELAFMSAVQRSETFPPNDPWMSGYSISYYHFGYVMSAMLATLSGISTTIGFNMTIALLFALTGLNTLGVVYNLLRAPILAYKDNEAPASRTMALGIGLLGTVMVVLLGNFQLPLIELGYQSTTVSQSYLDFWDAQDRYTATEFQRSPEELVNIGGIQVSDPTRWSFWWWFRASRVINDRHIPSEPGVVGSPVGANVIDEFPQFSFLLADVHPHVLALPFAVMAIGLALNMLLCWHHPTLAQLIFYGLAAGGLMFLNMWDGPIYMVVLVGAEGLRRLMRNGGRYLSADDGFMLLMFFLSLIGMALIFYLPFFISFRSQASGIIPNLEFPTLFRQYFIMFGPFLLLLTPYLVYECWRARHEMNWRAGISIALGLLVALVVLVALLVAVGALVPALRGEVMRFIVERGGFERVVPIILTKRLTHSVTTVVLLVLLVMVISRLFQRRSDDEVVAHQAFQENSRRVSYRRSTGFALLMIACAVGLTLVPEFVYLRDNFGVRINTIFKFYYQAWVMFAIASAYAVYVMMTHPSFLPMRVIYSALLVLVLFLGLLYPVLGIHNRAIVESGRISAIDARPLSLDGGPSLATSNDYQAIQCLNNLVQDDDAVVAEAIGPAYRHQYGRVGVLTGIPIVLGWEGHERQWRGATYPQVAGTRRADIEMLYNDLRWEVAASIIELYDIDYIFYGATERYGTNEQPAFSVAGEDKFRENLEVVCEFGDSLFYQVTPDALELAGVRS